MLTEPMDVLRRFEVRKNKKQKQAFRDGVTAYARQLGYPVQVEKGSMGAKNVVIGNPAAAEYLITAHYDTPARMILPNFLTPCNLLTFLGYQILMTLVMMMPSAIVGYLVNLLTDNFALAYLVWYGLFLATLVLMLAGPANPHTANDNTSGVVTLLEIARSLPEVHRNKVCFLLFDLEEKGLKGSAAYRKAHKAVTENQILLNLDCVGDGDHILLMPTKKLRKDAAFISRLKYLGGWFGKKQILTIDKGFCVYSSDHKNFPLAVGIGAFHKRKGTGFVLDKIHTKHDTNLEITNVNLLRAALTTLISGDAVN